MTDGASYVGRRVVVVDGAGLPCAAPMVRPLVEGGAEVHVVTSDEAAVRAVRGLASSTVCDVGSAGALEAAIGRIGAVVQHLFHCVGAPGDAAASAFAAAALAVRPLMHVGGSVIAVAPTNGPASGGGAERAVIAAFVEEHRAAFAADGVVLTTAAVDEALSAGLA